MVKAEDCSFCKIQLLREKNGVLASQLKQYFFFEVCKFAVSECTRSPKNTNCKTVSSGLDPTARDATLKIIWMQTNEADIPSMDGLICQHVDLKRIKKIGEGTFGEAYKGNNVVLKIVPMDGATLVNGEIQKRAEEIYAEASVALTLNLLRDFSGTLYQTYPPKVKL